MDVDDVRKSSAYAAQSSNAVAGPSNIHIDPLPLFLSQQPAHVQPISYLSSTQDLLFRFNLLPAYDKYVRPFVTPVVNGNTDHAPSRTSLDKGKGKERDLGPTSPPHTPADAADGDEEEGKGEKKRKNTYKHLIRGVPGKHSMKKDEYLTTIMQVPPKQRISISQFDPRTQREAFTVSLEGLKGWNIHSLVLESSQAREDRRKRKELKKLAKQQAVLGVHAPFAPGAASSAPGATPASLPSAASPAVPPPVQSSAFSPARTDTPKPDIPRSTIPPSISSAASVASQSSPIFSPTAKTTMPSLRTGNPSASVVVTGPFASAAASAPRGKKRELEEMISPSGPGPGAAGGGGVLSAVVEQKVIVSSKAGSTGVRPRPLKKPRTDIGGQMREVAMQQQPTPQGV